MDQSCWADLVETECERGHFPVGQGSWNETYLEASAVLRTTADGSQRKMMQSLYNRWSAGCQR